ncbi:MAG: glycine cleavage system aminomethyltransferase GcvT [Porticoccaceae bacterium]
MGNRTALFDRHQALGGKMVDFGGWDMPLHYGSQIREHEAVRSDCGMFDVSHMRVADVTGPQALAFLRYLLANDVAKAAPGKAIYSAMLNPEGGIIDDLIVYVMADDCYRLVLNCATGEADIQWMRRHIEGFEAALTPRPELGIIAVQGPNAIARLKAVACGDAGAALDAMSAFACAQVGSWTLARTGYTGEDGAEIILPAEKLEDLWQRLLDAGVVPAGLGARDTLRLEAGLNLYGNDMDAEHSPLESNLAWTVAWEPAERDFIGREALARQRTEGVRQRLVGLVMTGRGVLRAHQVVRVPGSDERGEITSGTFSPTLGHAIALARVPASAKGEVFVDMRGKDVAARIVKPGFVKNGKSQIQDIS